MQITISTNYLNPSDNELASLAVEAVEAMTGTQAEHGEIDDWVDVDGDDEVLLQILTELLEVAFFETQPCAAFLAFVSAWVQHMGTPPPGHREADSPTPAARPRTGSRCEVTGIPYGAASLACADSGVTAEKGSEGDV